MTTAVQAATRAESALVVLSGGQDSTTALFWAKNQFKRVLAVTFDYGQRHHVEIEAAMIIARMAKLDHHEVVNCRNLLVSSSPLTSRSKLEQYTDFKQMDEVIGDRVELTFVPMRNMFFMTVAMNRAVNSDCGNLVVGICQEDNANYPDCREPFRNAFEVAANAALGGYDFKVVAPLMYKSKAETCQLARSMPECWRALAYTHTSYAGEYPPTDKNHANILRAHGFEQAGLPDPLVIRASNDGLMALPTTPNYEKAVVDANWAGVV